MQYRLLCCSDTHGRAPPDFDDAAATAWLHAGDLYNGPDIVAGDDATVLPGDPIAETVLSWVRARRAPVYAVRGNHDVADPCRWFRSIHELRDGAVARLGPDLLLVGIGWHGQFYFDLPTEPEIEQVCDSARRQLRRLVMTGDRLVLLTHYPAKIAGLFPMRRGAVEEQGYEALTRLVQEIRPMLIVQGHEHGWAGLADHIDYGDSAALIINPGPRGMQVELNTTASVPPRVL